MNSAANGTPAFAVHDAIALDGDKPREDQRKGGNGFGINEEGAGYTLTGVDRHGVAYENDHLNECEVARSLNGDHDDRVTDSGTSVVHVATAYKLDSTASNSMKSANPNSGFHEEQVAACLDTTTPDPSKNQGGNVIVSTNSNGEDVAPTLTLEIAQMRYIVRRLTPTECERLMGLPDGYTIPAGLDANDPALVAEFQRIHDTFGAIMAEYAHKKPPKGKSYNQVAAWLKKISDPATCPDSPRYKGCGNGWATNQPRWILTRLLNVEGIEW